MYISFGILASIIAILEEFILGRYLGHTIYGMSIFVILPKGTIAIGSFIGVLIVKGSIIRNKKVKKSQYLCAFIITIATFLSINYMEYKTTYVTDDYEINRTGIGNPISDYTYIDDQGNEKDMTFINYEKYKLDNFDTVVSGKYAKNCEISTHGTKNYLMYFADVAGMVLGGLLGVLASQKNDIYCNECSKYKKEKKLFKFSQKDYEDVINILSSNKLNNEFVKSTNSLWKKDNNPVYYEAYLVYCTGCRSGQIYIKQFKTKNDTEVLENRENITLQDYGIVENLISF